jgi:hypothetical protein
MPLREAAAVTVAAMAEVATVEAVTEGAGIFTAAAMAGGISAVVDATSAAVRISAVADRLHGRVFAAIVLSPSTTQDQAPCGR